MRRAAKRPAYRGRVGPGSGRGSGAGPGRPGWERRFMTTTNERTPDPGVRAGSTSEFTLFFTVLPGHAGALRQDLATLQSTPGYRPGDYELPIATIHEARFALFDDDTRLLFATSFDGSWDAYM